MVESSTYICGMAQLRGRAGRLLVRRRIVDRSNQPPGVMVRSWTGHGADFPQLCQHSGYLCTFNYIACGVWRI